MINIIHFLLQKSSTYYTMRSVDLPTTAFAFPSWKDYARAKACKTVLFQEVIHSLKWINERNHTSLSDQSPVKFLFYLVSLQVVAIS